MTNNEQSDDDQLTQESDIRWTYLASLLAGVVVIGFVVLIGAAALGHANLDTIESGWFYLVWLLVVTATGWVFGTDILDKYSRVRNR